MDQRVNDFIKSLNTILIGKNERIELITAAILAGGNILLEDNPGVGKTIVSKAIASLISRDEDGTPVKFSRIQATPDLLPYDITGVDIYNQDLKEFVFKPGPVFADILLTDELNRTTPKVQSALLEAMAERQVTVGRNTYKLSEVFFVVATQNPVESEGTYPLPAAQLDRFMVSLNIGYPDMENERTILKSGGSENRLKNLKPVMTVSQLLAVREEAAGVYVDDKLLNAMVLIADQSRTIKELRLGLSTRALLMMKKIASALAYIKGRDYVTDQDIIELSSDVWAHRLIGTNPHVDCRNLIGSITIEQIKKVL